MFKSCPCGQDFLFYFTRFSIRMEQQKGDNTFIFQDENGNYLSREEYLSGDVVKKLKLAQTLADSNPAFINNVQQLEKVQPTPIPAVDIYAPLHARWIPQKYIREFIAYLAKTQNFDLAFSASADSFDVRFKENTPQLHPLATQRRNAAWVVQHALNGIEPKVIYTVTDENGKKTQETDIEDTQLAKANYRKIKQEWDDWKFADLDRREKLAETYNAKFNTTVLRIYDGKHLILPGMVGYQARPHQKDAIYRNVQQMGGINDHRVGAGKTFVQVATAMELRRLGFASKPMIIGLKSQIPQLYAEFKKMYPLSKVLFPEEKDFQKENRKQLLNNIATNDWDCIIISHDQFNRIEQPKDIQIEMTNELMNIIRAEMEGVEDKKELKQLEKKLVNYEQKIEKLLNTPKDKDVLGFDELGIDFLMVDESQEFKNLEFSTTKKNIRGLGNPTGSKKAFNMLVACRHLQNIHDGDKGILFASGTPISNSMAELYLLFKFLRPNKMKEMGIDSFDRWGGNFANDYSDLEFYMGKFKEVHRFREFANLPELLTLYKEIADVKNDTNITLDKPSIRHELYKIKPSNTQLRLIEKLQKYIDTKGNDYANELGITAGYDERKGVNPSFALLAINYAKKLSLDPRLIDKKFPAGSKISAAVDNIADIYLQSSPFKGTQLVFCDIGTPKSSNQIDNLYEFLSGTISESDLTDIFGEEYYEKQSKPKLEVVLNRMTDVLNLNEDIDENVSDFDKLGEAKKLLREANQMENFNVYDELKNLLIQKGIPENQIAFIHDYKTRQQKESLYEKANNGDIRILLGSTKKLGTGVNVQQRCVAGHHLDINWRPSDIEQRNGRFERQGNIFAKSMWNNEVQSYYYATERTLDASMYNTVSQKAKFINQMKVTTNNDLRTVKDIQEDVDMGTMAAELSGDPIFKEKATLTKRITELQQLERSYNAKKYELQSLISKNESSIENMKNTIGFLSAALPQLEKIPKNEKGENLIVANVNGRVYDKVGEMATALITEAEMAKKYKPDGSQFLLGELWGFKIMGSITNNFMTDERELKYAVFDSNFNKIAQEKDFPTGEMAIALQVRNAIINIPENIQNLKASIATKTEQNTQYAEQQKTVFPEKEELNKGLERMAEVDAIILQREKEKLIQSSEVNDAEINSTKKNKIVMN